MKRTKQGVRDLSGIKAGPSKGVKLEMPPANIACKHPTHKESYSLGLAYIHCTACGEELSCW